MTRPDLECAAPIHLRRAGRAPPAAAAPAPWRPGGRRSRPGRCPCGRRAGRRRRPRRAGRAQRSPQFGCAKGVRSAARSGAAPSGTTASAARARGSSPPSSVVIAARRSRASHSAIAIDRLGSHLPRLFKAPATVVISVSSFIRGAAPHGIAQSASRCPGCSHGHSDRRLPTMRLGLGQPIALEAGQHHREAEVLVAAPRAPWTGELCGELSALAVEPKEEALPGEIRGSDAASTGRCPSILVSGMTLHGRPLHRDSGLVTRPAETSTRGAQPAGMPVAPL